MAKKILTAVVVGIVIAVAVQKAGSPGAALDNFLNWVSTWHLSNG